MTKSPWIDPRVRSDRIEVVALQLMKLNGTSTTTVVESSAATSSFAMLSPLESHLDVR